ncbi:hypothetical protein KI387_009811, partial [Taxus chinensis]
PRDKTMAASTAMRGEVSVAGEHTWATQNKIQQVEMTAVIRRVSSWVDWFFVGVAALRDYAVHICVTWLCTLAWCGDCVSSTEEEKLIVAT